MSTCHKLFVEMYRVLNEIFLPMCGQFVSSKRGEFDHHNKVVFSSSSRGFLLFYCLFLMLLTQLNINDTLHVPYNFRNNTLKKLKYKKAS